MDCSTYFLSHNDLGPTNIFIDGDEIAIIDWDLAGYCPLAWVRTKFAICGALDVEHVSTSGMKHDSTFRIQVEHKLESLGFPKVTEAYKEMDWIIISEDIQQRK